MRQFILIAASAVSLIAGSALYADHAQAQTYHSQRFCDLHPGWYSCGFVPTPSYGYFGGSAGGNPNPGNGGGFGGRGGHQGGHGGGGHHASGHGGGHKAKLL